ncbi:MAG: tRNA preQ1(34) S-adenosylmethionine ribosyltransferase-isomerase QueA [Bdellovibrionaceae bacterium]|nr:tRNA preQ1(34) S-adenosylmethionine ribosyltransferase-isomerase QueA [Pseudobdellovibrionaceae bacterium]|tara:strand:+ start:10576 stop:11589 length:1014 start_codon:yes stop_codon:yes gene_type:complete
MQLADLQFEYPSELIATTPSESWRALLCENGDPIELEQSQVLDQIQPGDAFVINDTKVLKRRVFTESGLEILFLHPHSDQRWEVLFPAKKYKVGDAIPLPGGREATLIEKGIPQTIQVDAELEEEYFLKYAELALPPYIQQSRSDRHNNEQDENWYQTDWCKNQGSFAAPTASLHFDSNDLDVLKNKGVHVLPITLHVGLGTFLPIRTDSIEEHKMHSEWASLPKETLDTIRRVQASGGRVWALGTTVTRALESWAQGLLEEKDSGDVAGWTEIFIKPGYEFKCVSGLMTNFHQPGSTLMALVAAFSGLDTVRTCYQFAVEKKFRLFSYGDLSLWKR